MGQQNRWCGFLVTNPVNDWANGRTTHFDLPHDLRFRFLSSTYRFISVQSGMPVTVTQATNNNSFAGIALQRPNLGANPNLSPDLRTPVRFFNTLAFSTAPQFTFGTASRNPVNGPAYRDLDLAMAKHISLPGETSIEFRGEIFDILNTPEFSQPNGSFGAPAFGSITSTVTDPRVVQFAIRISR